MAIIFINVFMIKNFKKMHEINIRVFQKDFLDVMGFSGKISEILKNSGFFVFSEMYVPANSIFGKEYELKDIPFNINGIWGIKLLTYHPEIRDKETIEYLAYQNPFRNLKNLGKITLKNFNENGELFKNIKTNLECFILKK